MDDYRDFYQLVKEELYGNKPGLKLKYTFTSIYEFYRMAMNVSPTGNKNKHDKMSEQHIHRTSWLGYKDPKDKDINKFSWKEKIADIEKESMQLVQGYKKRIYKYDELDGDDINMERLYEHLPAMKKRVYVKGDKFGNFISFYFNAGVDCGVKSDAIMNKTYTASKLINFFESLNKRVEVILYFKAMWPGKYKGENVREFTIEIVAKEFSSPLNIGLLNTVLAPWFFRYWMLMFMDTRMDVSYGHGYPGDWSKSDLERHKGNRVILMNGYDCLTEQKSEDFIKQVLENEKTSVV
jgi:hypothetical protein